MSSQKKARGLPGMKEGPLVQMLDRQRVQQAAADEAKKLVDAAALAAERLVDATKEAEETATTAAAAAALSAFDDFGVQQVRGLLEIYRKDISKGGHRYPALLSDSTLPQYEVYKKLVWERGWGGGGKSDEDVYVVIIMDDSLRQLLPDLVILIEIEGVQWLETAKKGR
jgi:hypothetical protein